MPNLLIKGQKLIRWMSECGRESTGWEWWVDDVSNGRRKDRSKHCLRMEVWIGWSSLCFVRRLEDKLSNLSDIICVNIIYDRKAGTRSWKMRRLGSNRYSCTEFHDPTGEKRGKLLSNRCSGVEDCTLGSGDWGLASGSGRVHNLYQLVTGEWKSVISHTGA